MQMHRYDTESTTRILIVDDHELLRDGLMEMLGHRPGLEVCGEAAGEDEAFAAVCDSHPNVVIVDICLQQGDGIQLVKRIKSHDSTIQVIVCSMHDEKLYGLRSLRAGASGYVHKQAPARQILDAIEVVVGGHIYTSPTLAEYVESDATRSCETAIALLANRELEVFTLIGQGRANGEIAEQMGLSQRTIDTYRERIKSKLGLKTSSELGRRAAEWVLLEQ